MEKKRIEPNFFISAPYLELAKIEIVSDGTFIWPQEASEALAQPILQGNSSVACSVASWCTDYGNLPGPSDYYSEFFDWEYLFHSDNFKNMEGKQWQVFRKNCRKWPIRNPGWFYSPILLDEPQQWSLFYDWLERRSNIQEGEIIYTFLDHSSELIGKAYLYSSEQELMGINVWDWNYLYINYRFCLVRSEHPFLDEFMRRLFYSSLSGKTVNDGGSLGKIGLEYFKDKMNPIRKRPVKSWKIKD